VKTSLSLSLSLSLTHAMHTHTLHTINQINRQSQINTLLVVQSNLFGSTSELQFQKCPKGTTQTSFDNSCVSCLEGSYSDTEDAFECLSCKAGTFSDSPNQESCTPCRKNFVSRESGATLCTECPGGKHSIEGSSECESCGVCFSLDVRARSCLSLSLSLSLSHTHTYIHTYI